MWASIVIWRVLKVKTGKKKLQKKRFHDEKKIHLFFVFGTKKWCLRCIVVVFFEAVEVGASLAFAIGRIAWGAAWCRPGSGRGREGRIWDVWGVLGRLVLETSRAL